LKAIKTTSLYFLCNLVLLFVTNNLYQYEGQWFFWALITFTIPNIIGFFLHLPIQFILSKISMGLTLQILGFFLINEFAFGVYERRIIFFGLLNRINNPDYNPIDTIPFVLISCCSLASASIACLYFRTPKFTQAKSSA
jgi:hypothetical protein